jgi:hypothetical protein
MSKDNRLDLSNADVQVNMCNDYGSSCQYWKASEDPAKMTRIDFVSSCVVCTSITILPSNS